jgi:hypothetical protein
MLAKIPILPLFFHNLEDCALFMARVKWEETSEILDLPKAWRRGHGEMGRQRKMGERENY